MKRNLLFFLISALTVMFYACSGSGVRVTRFSPQGEIKNLTTFKVEFSENLAPQSAQDKWVDDEYITFEPKIEGKFKWTSGNTLIFSPDVPLQPIQSYKAEVTDKVLFGRDVSLKSYTYEFRTQDFDVTKVDFFWTHIPNEQYQIGIKANIYFNYPVNPGMLKDYLSFNKDGEALSNFNIMSDKASDIIAVDLGNIQQTDKEQQLSVAVKKGLMSVIGKKGLEDNREFKYKLPPLTRLAITGVTSGLSDNKKWIEVSTTQRVDDKKLKDYVKLNPKTDVTFYVNENSFRIEGAFDNLQNVDLIINKGLPGLYGGELAYEFEQQVTFANLDPSLSFADQKGKYLMLTGQKNLELSAVNIPGVDIEVSQVYKNNVLFFLRQYNRYNYYDDYYDNYSPYYDISAYGHQLFKRKEKTEEQSKLAGEIQCEFGCYKR